VLGLRALAQMNCIAEQMLRVLGQIQQRDHVEGDAEAILLV
jgi:hypothetical protein